MASEEVTSLTQRRQMGEFEASSTTSPRLSFTTAASPVASPEASPVHLTIVSPLQETQTPAAALVRRNSTSLAFYEAAQAGWKPPSHSVQAWTSCDAWGWKLFVAKMLFVPAAAALEVVLRARAGTKAKRQSRGAEAPSAAEERASGRQHGVDTLYDTLRRWVLRRPRAPQTADRRRARGTPGNKRTADSGCA